MRLLDRYLGREILVTGAFAVATLSFVIVLGQIFKKLFEYIVEHDAPASFIITFIGYALPASLSLTTAPSPLQIGWAARSIPAIWPAR